MREREVLDTGRGEGMHVEVNLVHRSWRRDRDVRLVRGGSTGPMSAQIQNGVRFRRRHMRCEAEIDWPLLRGPDEVRELTLMWLMGSLVRLRELLSRLFGRTLGPNRL